jgi:hypothetical protein
MNRAMRSLACVLGLMLCSMTPALGRQMDLRRASGVPLPASDIPAGTVSVRVVRDSFANNLSGVDVVFSVDDRPTAVTTDASGRAQIAGLAPGVRVRARATVDDQLLESQEVTIGSTGIRFVLVAGGAAGAAPREAPASRGTVSLGPESRVVAEYSNERLNIYYVMQVVNTASSPVDIGGPLAIDLPQGARGGTVIEGTTGKATVNGARLIVTGPFQPGSTSVNVAFELPFSGATARLEQQWPVDLQRLTMFALKTGDLDLDSPQFASKQLTDEQGQPLVVGYVNALPAGRSLSVTISGLPHEAVWPRNTALALGGFLTLAGIWAAVVPASRRRHA